MQKKYVVRLTDSERDLLNSLVKKQRVSAQKVLRARVLLKTDAQSVGGIAGNQRQNHPDLVDS
jgi:hypothetical protein